MTIDIADFPINSMVIFHSYVNVYQGVKSQESMVDLLVLSREWMGCWGLLGVALLGVAGMIITSDCGSFPKIPY